MNNYIQDLDAAYYQHMFHINNLKKINLEDENPINYPITYEGEPIN